MVGQYHEGDSRTTRRYIRISCRPIQLHNIRQQLWDPGILAIYECNFLISCSGPFFQHLEKNTPVDNMQMDFILLLAHDILGILVLLLRALLLVLLNDKYSKLEQAVHRNLWVCAKKSALPSRQHIRGYQILVSTSCLSVQAAVVFMIARWEHWGLEYCRFNNKYVNPLLWPIGILQSVHN
jgi:hypothetical protein